MDNRHEKYIQGKYWNIRKKCLSLFVDECLKQKIVVNLKIVRINFDKAAGYEMNTQDNCTVYTSINELENVILNRYLSEEQKWQYSKINLTKTYIKTFGEITVKF